MLGLFKRRAKKLTRELLTSCRELAGLAPAQLDYIIKREVVSKHREGDWIFRENDPATRTFLLSGVVQVKMRDGTTRQVDATAQACPQPLDRGDDQAESAHCITAAQTFKVPVTLLQRSEPRADASPAERAGMVVEELSPDEAGGMEGQLAYRIYDDAVHERLSLPSLPELALTVSRAVNNPDSSTAQVARIIQSDVSITARLVQIANGPLYRGNQAIQTCHEAVTRMGLQVTRDMVTNLSMRQMFSTDDPRLARRLRHLWRHSTRVAAVSAVLAKMVPGVDPERAMLAGLMHDIGVLVILKYVNDLDNADYSEEELDGVIDHLRAEIGAAVLRKWNFDDDLVGVAMEVENYTRDSRDGPDYCDIVTVAQIHCLFGTPEIHSCPPLLDVPAFLKLPLQTGGPEKSIETLREAQADIDEVVAMLQF